MAVECQRRDEATAMTAAESRAFVRGFAYGVEQAINAHDALIPILTDLQWAVRAGIEEAGDKVEAWRAVTDIDRRILAVMHRVRHVREQGALESLPLFQMEVGS